jgi:polyphosphate kinase 2 (PPK2 family)
VVDLADRLDHLQEALYAEATGGGARAVLLVLQGMDTSGKGGVIRHVGGLVHPQGLHIATVKKPTEAELAHHFLWRVRMLHISAKEQAERLVARVDNPAKRWEHNPGDLDARAKWPAYQEAYAEALHRTDTAASPWYVIPSDREWYRNWAVAALLAETLGALDPPFPQPSIDVDAERARLAASVVLRPAGCGDGARLTPGATDR